jgi:hypothetical protein
VYIAPGEKGMTEEEYFDDDNMYWLAADSAEEPACWLVDRPVLFFSSQ